MKLLKILGRIVLGLIAVAVLLYLGALAINWRDEPPSPAARTLAQILDGRPAVPAAENSFAYLLGLAAPPDSDPAELGAQRLVWLENFSAATSLDTDPLGAGIRFSEVTSPAIRKLAQDCGWDVDRRNCAETFDSIAVGFQPNSSEALLLKRYDHLMALKVWREVVPRHVSMPLANYADAIHGQRLNMIRLMQFAADGKADEVRLGLAADFAFWRNVLSSSDILISKMIAVAGIRNHYFLAQRVLRRLPVALQSAAMPADWSHEFSTKERSVLNPMAGELRFSSGIVRDSPDPIADYDETEASGAPSVGRRVLRRLQRPLYQPQATENLFAEDFLTFGQAFEVPIDQFPRVRKSFDARLGKGAVTLYNLPGMIMHRDSAMNGKGFYGYAYRSASVEAWRRAALLIAQLRARGLSPEVVPAEVGSSDLRDPFSNASFEWSAGRRSVIFKEPAEFQRQREEYFY